MTNKEKNDKYIKFLENQKVTAIRFLKRTETHLANARLLKFKGED